ncbi:MAG: nucleotidyltransferase family protein [Patescibacteria group bacterium]|jgi:bifunctional UDP-N-acetylglucosamine pyrophosphorylase/glucosamine-1-phosphate N-acetyltransferase
MQAVILAAGKGTRMRPLTAETPKPMLRVQGKPLLAYTIELLPPEITEVILVIGYLGEQIRDYFGAEFNGRQITYVEQKELLGTGAALFLCKDILEGRFLVLAGDDVYDAADARRCLAAERCMLAKDIILEQTRYLGLIQLDDQGNLKDNTYQELPVGAKCLVDVGMFVLDEHIFEYDLVPVKDGQEFGLPSTIAKMARDYPVKVIKTDYWLPIGYPDDLKRAEIHLRKSE